LTTRLMTGALAGCEVGANHLSLEQGEWKIMV
jgi:hypothetical protein